MERVTDYSCGNTLYPHRQPRTLGGRAESGRLTQARPARHGGHPASRAVVMTAETKPTVLEEERDSRYRTIIGRIDSLLAKLQREPESNLTAELDRLISAMTDHFSTEDSAMMLVGFPDAETHTLSHQAICFGTAKVRYRFSKGDRVTHEELGFLRLLWREHIEMYDGAFERFLSPEEDAVRLGGAFRCAAIHRAARQ